MMVPSKLSAKLPDARGSFADAIGLRPTSKAN